MKLKHFTLSCLVLIAIILPILSGCRKNTVETIPLKSVTEVVAEIPNLTILNAALIKTGLADTLKKARLFTVFAPNDLAFQTLSPPFNSIAAINALAAGDPAISTLRTMLSFHIFGGKLSTAAMQTGLSLNRTLTLKGGADSLFISKSQTSPQVVSVNGAQVTEANREATYNGFVHIVNKVIFPPTGNIVQSALAAGNFKILLAALAKTGLQDDLEAPGPFTVFAPTDSTFIITLRSLNNTITNEATALNFINNTLSNSSTPNITTLTNSLLYHVTQGRLYASAMVADNIPNRNTLLTNRTLAFTYPGGAVQIVGTGNANQPATVKKADIQTTNGVIHTIDRVLLP